METTLSNRWGTDLQAWTARDLDDEDEEDDADAADEAATVATAHRVRSKPVQDPWQSKTNSKQRDGRDANSLPAPAPHTTTKQQQQRANNKLNVQHLIRSKPVGGKGTNDKIDVRDDSSENPKEQQRDYFFHPRRPLPLVPATTTTRQRSDAPYQPDTTTPASTTRISTPHSAAKASLLDSQGNPLYLTLAQAQRAFTANQQENLLLEDVDDDDNNKKSPSIVSWTDVGITSPILLRNLNQMNCPVPLSVQQKAVPAILNSTNDVIMDTYTGSGKTLAFLVPLAQRMINDNQQKSILHTIVVAPGRELASQIVRVARELLQDTNLHVMLAIGGTTFSRNVQQIRQRKPVILVGTPGRLAELIVGRGNDRTRSGSPPKTTNLQTIVLDEFDALLQYPVHRDPTEAVLDHVRRRHPNLQTVLCSATASDMLSNHQATTLGNYLRPNYIVAMADHNDAWVTSLSSNSPARVSRTVLHGVVHVPHRRLALETLRRILHTEPFPQQVLVFCENARRAQIVVDKLATMGIIAAPLYGGAEKSDRADVNRALSAGNVGLVVATELAARGLDAPSLTHVINLDLPTDASHYAHRAGRCGRGGRPGVVINLTTHAQERHVPQKFATQLGIDLYEVEARNGKLHMVQSATLEGEVVE